MVHTQSKNANVICESSFIQKKGRYSISFLVLHAAHFKVFITSHEPDENSIPLELLLPRRSQVLIKAIGGKLPHQKTTRPTGKIISKSLISPPQIQRDTARGLSLNFESTNQSLLLSILMLIKKECKTHLPRFFFFPPKRIIYYLFLEKVQFI